MNHVNGTASEYDDHINRMESVKQCATCFDCGNLSPVDDMVEIGQEIYCVDCLYPQE